MKFPSYVPAGAREHIRRTLEGNGSGWEGINAFVAEYRAKDDAADALQEMEREQSCLLRFARDDRMRDVYTELQKVFTSDDQYAEFLSSAWNADMNFAPFRERVKKAKALTPKIATAARELASLLGELGETHTVPPSELYSIRALLDATDNHEMGGHNLYMWSAVRGVITGKRRAPPPPEQPEPEEEAAPKQVVIVPEEEAAEAERNNPDALIVVIRHFKRGDIIERDHEKETRNTLGYAWGKAPDLPAILGTVAKAADNWTAQESGAIGAAIASRKKTRVTEYLRAFAELLRENLRMDLTAPIVAAMAATASVVLNLSDTGLSVDAVRMAIARAVNDSEKERRSNRSDRNLSI